MYIRRLYDNCFCAEEERSTTKKAFSFESKKKYSNVTCMPAYAANPFGTAAVAVREETGQPQKK